MKEKVLGIFEVYPGKQSSLLVEAMNPRGVWLPMGQISLEENQTFRMPFLMRLLYRGQSSQQMRENKGGEKLLKHIRKKLGRFLLALTEEAKIEKYGTYEQRHKRTIEFFRVNRPKRNIAKLSKAEHSQA